MFPQEIQKVYEDIKQTIVNSVYTHGQPLSEVELAGKYRIKRTRIRQIFQKLESEALVKRIPNKGVFIEQITPKDLKEIFEIREALEGIAARIAAIRRKDDGLRQIIASFEENVNGDFETKLKLGRDLHQFILESCGNTRIINSMEPLKIVTLRIWRTEVRMPDQVKTGFDEHMQILEALKNKNGDLAERRMREHISGAFKVFLNFMISNQLGLEELDLSVP